MTALTASSIHAIHIDLLCIIMTELLTVLGLRLPKCILLISVPDSKNDKQIQEFQM